MIHTKMKEINFQIEVRLYEHNTVSNVGNSFQFAQSLPRLSFSLDHFGLP